MPTTAQKDSRLTTAEIEKGRCERAGHDLTASGALVRVEYPPRKPGYAATIKYRCRECQEARATLCKKGLHPRTDAGRCVPCRRIARAKWKGVAEVKERVFNHPRPVLPYTGGNTPGHTSVLRMINFNVGMFTFTDEVLDNAACSPETAHLFAPDAEDKRAAFAAAKKICDGCPVRDLCLEQAVAVPKYHRIHGTVGGIFIGIDGDLLPNGPRAQGRPPVHQQESISA